MPKSGNQADCPSKRLLNRCYPNSRRLSKRTYKNAGSALVRFRRLPGLTGNFDTLGSVFAAKVSCYGSVPLGRLLFEWCECRNPFMHQLNKCELVFACLSIDLTFKGTGLSALGTTIAS